MDCEMRPSDELMEFIQRQNLVEYLHLEGFGHGSRKFVWSYSHGEGWVDELL